MPIQEQQSITELCICCISTSADYITILLNSLPFVVVYFEFEQSEYSALETEDIILGVVKRNATGRALTVLFSTRAGTAECK